MMQGPFREDLLEVIQGSDFSVTVNRAFKLREIRVVHGRWQRTDTTDKELALPGRMRVQKDSEWQMATRRRLRLRAQHEGMCMCGMKRDGKINRTLACQTSPWRAKIHNRIPDGLAQGELNAPAQLARTTFRGQADALIAASTRGVHPREKSTQSG